MKIGFTELLMVFIVALLVIGPDKLPQYARKLGSALAEFRKASDEAAREIQKNVVEPLEEAQRPLREAAEPVEEVRRAVRDNVNGVRRSVSGIGKSKPPSGGAEHPSADAASVEERGGTAAEKREETGGIKEPAEREEPAAAEREGTNTAGREEPAAAEV